MVLRDIDIEQMEKLVKTMTPAECVHFESVVLFDNGQIIDKGN